MVNTADGKTNRLYYYHHHLHQTQISDIHKEYKKSLHCLTKKSSPAHKAQEEDKRG